MICWSRLYGTFSCCFIYVYMFSWCTNYSTFGVFLRGTEWYLQMNHVFNSHALCYVIILDASLYSCYPTWYCVMSCYISMIFYLMQLSSIAFIYVWCFIVLGFIAMTELFSALSIARIYTLLLGCDSTYSASPCVSLLDGCITASLLLSCWTMVSFLAFMCASRIGLHVKFNVTVLITLGYRVLSLQTPWNMDRAMWGWGG